MSVIYPAILGCMTVALWWFTVWYAHRFLRAFCNRFLLVAHQEIPYAFDRFAHLEKAIYSFRRTAAEVTSVDPTSPRQRKRFTGLSVALLVFPLLWFLPLFIFAVIMSHKSIVQH
jgi:hypothetical protein